MVWSVEELLGLKPKVSIIIPVYNGSNYLKEAIDSALTQTYSNVEVIVINDGSNDGGKTQAIIDTYGEHIRSYTKPNGGVASALNLGIEKMKGEYFSWLSHDDQYLPNKVLSQMNKLKEVRNKKAILYSGYQTINREGTLIGTFIPSEKYPLEKYTHALFPVLRLLVNGCTVLLHKSHFKRVGVFNENLPTTQDYDFWFRAFRNQQIVYCEDIQVLSRSHPEQESKKNIQAHIKECDASWIRQLGSLSSEDLETIDDNAYAFFQKTYDFLQSRTLYYETIKYTKQRALLELRRLLLEGQSYEQVVDEKTELFDQESLAHALLHQPYLLEKKRRRIAFFQTKKNGIGGLSKATNSLATELTKFYEVFMILTNEPLQEGHEYENGVHFIQVSTQGKWTEHLGRLLVVLGVDVFIGGHNCLAYFINMYTLLKGYGIKCIAWNHEDYFYADTKPQFQEVVQNRKAIYQQLDAVVWINQRSQAMYEQEATNGAYIPDAVSFNEEKEVRKAEASEKETCSLIAVGRFDDPNKQLDKLLEVFSKISTKNPRVKLYIVGSYDLEMPIEEVDKETMRELIERLSIDAQQLVFTGLLSDVSPYYKKASIQLMTSKSEGFGLVIPEAALYGVPTIAFSNGGADSIIIDGENGFIVEPGQTSDMAERTLMLLEDVAQYNKMAAQTACISQNFIVDKVALRWKALLEHVMNKG